MTIEQAKQIISDRKLFLVRTSNGFGLNNTSVIGLNNCTVRYYYKYKSTPFCCGILEIGDFTTNHYLDQCLDKLGIDINLIKALLADHFRKIIQIKYDVVSNKRQLITFNLINKRACLIFKETIDEYFPNQFELIREFTNINSGHIVTSYMQII